METPSSTTRVINNNAISSINNSDSDSIIPVSSNKTEDSSTCQRKKEGKSVLIDITNDSPIVGLALQSPPSGFMVKRKRCRIKNTPGSGEALLRRQVKTLLHKVEEETDFNFHSLKTRPFIHLVTSPMRLLAPTPANTPQFPNFSDNDVKIKIASPVVAGHLRTTSQIYEEKEETKKSMSISRSLLFDFTDKSASCEEEEEEDDVDVLCEGTKKITVDNNSS